MRSKAVITGDITQIDLPFGRSSGLVEARNILGDVAGLVFCYFNENDVVRHRLVRLIIKAYQQHAESEVSSEEKGDNGKKAED
jgi:phosphate starvation-inducible PhoH-like protein